jgi:predicted Zn-dependent protease
MRRAIARTWVLWAAACVALGALAPPADATDFRRRSHAIVESTDLNLEDIKAELRFGRELGARILGRERLYENADLSRYVALVGNVLAGYSQRTELRFFFAVLDDDAVNAYSAPGGYVFVTRGALRAMRDESELAAVLAHEIAHIELKHIVKSLNVRAADSSFESGLGLLFGGGSDTARAAFDQAVEQATHVLFEEGFRIQEELDSDNAAIQMLANSGYDPTALQRFLERVDADETSSKSTKKRTHPTSETRMTELDRAINASRLRDVSAMRNPERFKSHEQFM